METGASVYSLHGQQEHDLLKKEYETRMKWSQQKWSTSTEKDCDFLLQNVPVIYRGEELYIAPEYPGWESRYYKTLLPTASDRQLVGQNYLEGSQQLH